MKMKKVLICILAMLSLSLLLGTITAFAASPASAGEELVIYAESVTASAGDTVTVTLWVTSNPGFSYLRLTVIYDEALVLTKAENGAILKDFDQGVNLMWSDDSQSSATGTLVTLTFTVAENAVLGEHPITVKFRECYNDNYDDVPTIVQNGNVTVTCAHKDFVTIEGVSPTCIEPGLTSGTACSICGEVLTAQEVIPATGHSYSDTIVPPTTEAEGYTLHTCSVCGHEYKDNFVDKLTYILGDVNENEVVDSADAIYLLRHTLFPNLFKLNQSGDMNGDATVDSADAIYLLRHTLFPNLFPLKASAVVAAVPMGRKEEAHPPLCGPIGGNSL